MKEVEISAPGKLMLFGEHAVVHERPCIVTAVDQRLAVGISHLQRGKVLIIDAPDVGVSGYELNISDLSVAEDMPKGMWFVVGAVRNFYEHYSITSGIRIKTKSEFSSEFGFGSSSAVTAATIAALSELFEAELTKKEIFDLSYKTVLDVQGVGSGFDLAAAIWGGSLYFVKGGQVVEPLEINELPMVIGYTGIKADTPTLVRRVASLKEEKPDTVMSIFDTIGIIVDKARKNISEGDFEEIGGLMNENQELLKKLGVSSSGLDSLVVAANQSGAYGAKLSGAGGGDCMIALVSEDNRYGVEEAIEEVGGKIIKVNMNAEGLRLE